jgi:glutamyl-tRNA reductase
VKLLVVGASHRSATVPLLERLTVPAERVPAMLEKLVEHPYVAEAVLLSTCNRVEVYAAVTAFHGGLAGIGALLAEQVGEPLEQMAQHLYMHYEADAIQHAFRVAAGLDSMVVGEAQILGQLRDAYGQAAERGATGRLLHELMQQALRVGKRVHAETEIDHAGQSVVSAALAYGQASAGPVEGRPALVIGAGAMGSLALATLRRAGAEPIFVTSRGFERATHLATSYGATPVPLEDLDDVLSTVDLVVTATASVDPVLDAERVARVGRELTILDLALPRDVGPGVAELPGITLVDIDRLSTALQETATVQERAAEEIVLAEVEAFLNWLRGSDVAPTVAALRARADTVVAAELRRLAQRCPGITDEQRAEIAHTLHRVVQRLLHQPTVRVRQLAAEPGGEAYAEALRELFDLHISEFESIGKPEIER